MAEDSLLLARLSRGILRYLYLISVGDANTDAAGAIVQEYMNIIKQTRALDTNPNSANFENKANPMGTMEDLFLPVFGGVDSLKVEKLGGEPDIKWITDIEELRNQLACTLRTPLSLLGGYVQEASGELGADSIEQLDIRFGRNSRRLQRALINGITRICQIHLAYIGMDPDATLFQVNMSETSSSEEKKLRESLKDGVDVIKGFMDLLGDMNVEVDKVAVLGYLNQKVLKLSDFEITKYVKADTLNELPNDQKDMIQKTVESIQKGKFEVVRSNISATNQDLIAPLPIADGKMTKSNIQKLNEWNSSYKGKKVKVEVKRLIEKK
jgi:antitoxin component HigA of HigAB toxin-antitoxin module